MAKKEYAPITVAFVREHGLSGFYSEVGNPKIRADGWLFDTNNTRWYSPENVLSVTTFVPKPWDGNGLKPGMLCLYNTWLGVTSERPTGMEEITVLLISRDAKRRLWNVLVNGAERLLPERVIVPVMDTK